MTQLARLLIATGIIFIVVGILFYLTGKIPGVGRLPGDFFIKKENFTFYFPLTSCILLSLIISFLVYLWNHR